MRKKVHVAALLTVAVMSQSAFVVMAESEETIQDVISSEEIENVTEETQTLVIPETPVPVITSIAAPAMLEAGYEGQIDWEGAGCVDNIADGILPAEIVESEGTARFYDQLDQKSKEVYETLNEAYYSGAQENGVVLALSNVWTAQTVEIADGSVVLSDQLEASIGEWADAIVSPAISALLYDHPELCWLTGADYMISYGIEPISYEEGAESVVTDITVNSVEFNVKEVITNVGNKETMDADVLAAKLILEGEAYQIGDSASRYEQVKAIHDYICSSIEYASDDIERVEYQTPYSAFHDVDGDGVIETVCAGYSKAFKLLCEAYDIPCVLVGGKGITSQTGELGEAHMWNLVQMEDSNWYAVDCTWDDQTEKAAGEIYYDFFLVGAETADENFGGKTFKESHLPSGSLSGNPDYNFNYPSLSTAVYQTEEEPSETESQEETTEIPTTEEGEPTTEVPTTEEEEPTTEVPTTEGEELTTEIPTTEEEELTTEIPTTEEEEPTTEVPTTEEEELTTEIPTTEEEELTTEIPTTEEEELTTEAPTTAAPTTAAPTTAVSTTASEAETTRDAAILGISDYSQIIGWLFVGFGVILCIAAIVWLIIKRRSGK